MNAKRTIATLTSMMFVHVVARHIAPPDTVKIDNNPNAEVITFEHNNWVLFDTVTIIHNPGLRGKHHHLKTIYSLRRLQVEGNVPVIYDFRRPE